MFYQKKSHSSSTCSEHRGHEQTSAAITPLVLSKLDFLQARQRKMGKHTNGASSQQNTYHLPKAPTATSNLIYLPTSIPHFPFLYIPPKLTDDISTPIIPAHLLYPQNSAIRVKCISSSKFPPKNTYTPSLPCPTHHPPNLTTLPPTNQKKAIKFSLALTRPYHKTSRSHSQPPPKKRNHQHHQHTPHPNTTPHHRILKNKSQPPPSATHKNQVPGISIAHIIS